MESACVSTGTTQLNSCPATGAVVAGQIDRLTDLGPIAPIRLGNRDAVFINNLALVREVLVKDAAAYRKSQILRKARRYVDGSQILSPEPVQRRRQHWVRPLLGPRAVAGYQPVTSELTDRLVAAWDPGPADLMALTCQLATEITLATLFGWVPPRLRSQMTQPLCATTAAVIESPLVDADAPFRPAVLRREQRRTSAQADLWNLIRQSLPATFGHGGRDFPDGAVAGAEPQPDPDTTPPAASELLILAVSSTVTTAVAACWTIHLLCQYPIYLAPIVRRNEAFTRCVVKEALRLYPPLWLFARDAVRPVDIGGHSFPAGTSVVFSPYSLHRNPEIYANPMLFDPGRWQSGRCPAPGRRFFASFGAGAHGCVGELAAWPELQIIIGSIVRRWELRVHPDRPVKPVGHMLLHPDRPEVILAPREGVAASIRAECLTNGQEGPHAILDDFAGSHF